MYTTLSGQVALFKHMEVIANNLANLNTTGFRAEKVLFEKMLAQQKNTTPIKVSTDEFVHIRGAYTDFQQGPIEATGNPLDMAIKEEGFFVVQTAEGERYTRAGNFQLDAEGRLVTSRGDPVQGIGGDIVLEGASIKVTEQGDILVDGKAVDRLRVVQAESRFLVRDQAQLFKLIEGGFTLDAENPFVQGGALEGSNVNAVRELTDMIWASRLYESYQKVQESNNRMADLRNQSLGRIQG